LYQRPSALLKLKNQVQYNICRAGNGLQEANSSLNEIPNVTWIKTIAAAVAEGSRTSNIKNKILSKYQTHPTNVSGAEYEGFLLQSRLLLPNGAAQAP
jgi:hypothetical protein